MLIKRLERNSKNNYCVRVGWWVTFFLQFFSMKYAYFSFKNHWSHSLNAVFSNHSQSLIHLWTHRISLGLGKGKVWCPACSEHIAGALLVHTFLSTVISISISQSWISTFGRTKYKNLDHRDSPAELVSSLGSNLAIWGSQTSNVRSHRSFYKMKHLRSHSWSSELTCILVRFTLRFMCTEQLEQNWPR